MGWCVYFLQNYCDELGERHGPINNTPLGINKHLFYEYVMQFGPVCEAVAHSRQAIAAHIKSEETGDEGHRFVGFGKYKSVSMRDMATSVLPEHPG